MAVIRGRTRTSNTGESSDLVLTFWPRLIGKKVDFPFLGGPN